MAKPRRPRKRKRDRVAEIRNNLAVAKRALDLSVQQKRRWSEAREDELSTLIDELIIVGWVGAADDIGALT